MFASEVKDEHNVQLLVDKVHILRRGDRWIRCHLQGVRVNDVVPRRGKDIR